MIDELLERFKALPEMTPEEAIEQKIDFVWGNLAASTNHQQPKSAIAAMVWKIEWRKLRDYVDGIGLP